MQIKSKVSLPSNLSRREAFLARYGVVPAPISMQAPTRPPFEERKYFWHKKFTGMMSEKERGKFNKERQECTENYRRIRIQEAATGGSLLICHYCRCLLRIKEIWSKDSFTADHRQPVNFGGLNERENLVDACSWCNFTKGAMTEAEFKMFMRAVADYHIPTMAEYLKTLA